MADPVLRTPRLVLRRMRIEDIDDFHAVFTDPRAMRYWSRPPHESLEATREFVEGTIAAHERGQAEDFAVELGGRVIGKAGAWDLPEIGFILHPDHWGQGLAREAVEAVITHLFSTRNLPRLTADVDPRNAGSIGLLSRLCFRETGRAERTLKWGDEWCDSVYFALDRGAWDGRSKA